MDIFLTYFLKPVVLFLITYFFIRFGGKKTVSEMNGFDLIVLIVLGVIIGEPLVSRDPVQAIIYGVVFLFLYLLLSYASTHPALQPLFVDQPVVLIRNGDIDEDGLQKKRVTADDVVRMVRQQGYARIDDIELGVMEDGRQISIIPKAHARPLEPRDINLHPSPAFIPIPLIMNGRILYDNLTFLEKDTSWLNLQLKAYEKDIDTLSDVTLATYNHDGTISLDTKKATTANPNHNPYLYKPGTES